MVRKTKVNNNSSKGKRVKFVTGVSVLVSPEPNAFSMQYLSTIFLSLLCTPARKTFCAVSSCERSFKQAFIVSSFFKLRYRIGRTVDQTDAFKLRPAFCAVEYIACSAGHLVPFQLNGGLFRLRHAERQLAVFGAVRTFFGSRIQDLFIQV